MSIRQLKDITLELCNAPATFERLMNTVLKRLSWMTCLVYLDDLIVMGKIFRKHLRHMEEVLQRLRGVSWSFAVFLAYVPTTANLSKTLATWLSRCIN